MNPITFLIEEDHYDGGYIAEAFITENEHIVTQGDNIEELKMMIKDALICHFENPLEIPSSVILKFVRQEVFAL